MGRRTHYVCLIVEVAGMRLNGVQRVECVDECWPFI